MVEAREAAHSIPEEHRPYLLIARLARALSHQIRTPLNVINNDLIYFKRFVDEEECERGITRCEQITRLLHTLNLLGNSDGPLTLLDFREIVADIKDRYSLELECSFSNSVFPVRGNSLQLKKAFDHLFHLLKNHSWLDKQQSARLFLDQKEQSGVTLTVNKPISELSICNQQCAACDSLTELFTSLLSSQSVLPPLLDAILWNHRVSTYWCVDNALLSICFTFPVVEG